MLIAPASTDFMAKLAHGMADDLLSTLCVARACPLLVAPAMNLSLIHIYGWMLTRRPLKRLTKPGVSTRMKPARMT